MGRVSRESSGGLNGVKSQEAAFLYAKGRIEEHKQFCLDWVWCWPHARIATGIEAPI